MAACVQSLDSELLRLFDLYQNWEIILYVYIPLSITIDTVATAMRQICKINLKLFVNVHLHHWGPVWHKHCHLCVSHSNTDVLVCQPQQHWCHDMACRFGMSSVCTSHWLHWSVFVLTRILAQVYLRTCFSLLAHWTWLCVFVFCFVMCVCVCTV